MFFLHSFYHFILYHNFSIHFVCLFYVWILQKMCFVLFIFFSFLHILKWSKPRYYGKKCTFSIKKETNMKTLQAPVFSYFNMNGVSHDDSRHYSYVNMNGVTYDDTKHYSYTNMNGVSYDDSRRFSFNTNTNGCSE